jgi:hypothetical protein
MAALGAPLDWETDVCASETGVRTGAEPTRTDKAS